MTIPVIRPENPDSRSITVKQPMSFGPALELLKMGAKITSFSWNGVVLGREVYLYLWKFPGDIEHNFQPVFCLRMDGLDQPGWLPTQGDLLREDYYIWPMLKPKTKDDAPVDG